jgi:hypothetical protein
MVEEASHALTRRELLAGAGALGLGALAGCPLRSRAAPAVVVKRAIPGGFAGQDPERGHLLRSGELLKKSIAETIDVDYLIVGAGVAGLACAWRLRREGLDGGRVLVLELADAAGGNARSGANAVSGYPWGAHYLRAPTRESRGLATFLEEIKVVRGRDKHGRLDFDTRFVCSEPVERIFEGGIWGEGLFPPPKSGTADDAAELARFRGKLKKLARVRDAEGRRLFAIPVERSSRDPALTALDGLSFSEWLDDAKNGGPYEARGFRWLLEYGCRDDYGSSLETTSAWAGLHYFLARGLEDEDVPEDERDRGTTLVWPEGNGWLVARLLEARGGARVALNQLVYRLEPGGDHEPPSALAWDLARGRAVRYRAKELIYAGARFLLGKLLEEPPQGLEDFTYVPWLTANLVLSRAPGGVGAPLSWDNVIYESPSLGYVWATRGRAPGERHVITWYHAFAEHDLAEARRKLFAMSFDEARDMCLSDLERAHPGIAATVERLDAWRWGHAMIRPAPGGVFSFGRLVARDPIGRILTANSDKGGLPIFEEAFFQGAKAGEEALAREGRRFESIL